MGTSRRGLAWVAFVLVVQIVLSLVAFVHHLARGGDEPVEWVSMLGLAWVPVVVWAAIRAVRLHHQLAASAEVNAQHLDHVLSVTREWLWTVDPAGRFLSSTGPVEELLGVQAESLVGRSVSEITHSDDRATLAGWWQEQTAARNGWERAVLRVAHRDGQIRHLDTTGIPIVDDRGRLLGYRGSARDVTSAILVRQREKRQERELAGKRRAIESLLIDRSQIRMVFQPIVDLTTSEVVGVEALARFDVEPARPPNVWFAEAADVGLGALLEVTAVRQAVAAMDQLGDQMYLSVNASPQTLVALDLFEIVSERPEIGPRLVIELTEHETITDYDRIDEALQRLRTYGVRCAVDDAGAGYSTLRHILRLRPESIKLDRTLTAGIDQDPVRRSLAAALVAFCASTDSTLIAEGVEREEELRALMNVGVRYGQGYLLGRPAPLDTLR